MSMIEQPSTEIFNYSDTHSFNLSKLAINEYYVVFRHSLQGVIRKVHNQECHNCLPLERGVTNEQEDKLSSKYSESWHFSNADYDVICDIEPNVQEFGCYEMDIDNCTLNTLLNPVNIGLPILTVILIFLAASIPVLGGIYFYNKVRKSEGDAPEVKKERVRSIDTFRGISITLMMLVNYGGGGYNFLEHAIWNGLTLADVVFPWFLWIMGVCIPISLKSAMKRGDRIYLHIVKRSAILFMLGIIVNGIDIYYQPSESSHVDYMNIYYLRIFGVLQRLGLCYIVAATICALFMKKEVPETPGMFQDIMVMLPQWTVALLCVIVHTALTFGLEFPDCPVVGYLGPGGVQGDEDDITSYGKYINCTGGAVGYIDRAVLGGELMQKLISTRNGLEQIPILKIYKVVEPVDPEGIIGTFNAVFQVILGVQAGMTLLIYKTAIGKVSRWMIWGVVSGLIGGGLCSFAKEDGVIPINKTLWSLSFVLVTSCFAFIILSILHVIIDAKRYWSGKPFLFAGMNSIILYMGQALTYLRFPFAWGFLDPSFHFQLLSQAVWGTMTWLLISYWLYKTEFFLAI